MGVKHAFKALCYINLPTQCFNIKVGSWKYHVNTPEKFWVFHHDQKFWMYNKNTNFIFKYIIDLLVYLSWFKRFVRDIE